MRVYIIGDDGIMLCHGTPTAVNEGEISVGSVAELRAAPLSSKRLRRCGTLCPVSTSERKLATAMR